MVVPFLQTPDWCTNGWANYCEENGIKNYRTNFVYHCEFVSTGTTPKLNLQFSKFPDVAPLYTGTTDILCLLTLCFFRCYKQKWRRMSRKNTRRTQALCIISACCIVDNIWAIYSNNYAFFAAFLKPVVVLIFSSSIRGTLRQVAFNAKDSITVILAIILYIFFYSIVGYYMFRG